jgi:sarcosine oxidase subunit gamma
MAELTARSPLDHRAAELAGVVAATGGRVSLSEIPFLGQVDVRVSRDEVIRRELLLPLDPNTVLRDGERAALWLGPDEWLVVGPAGTAAAVVAELESALIGVHRSVVDVSANRAWVELGGEGVRELLSKGCSIDLHSSRWLPGMCAQTMLARSQVVLEQLADATTRIGVRPSFADYIVDWLLESI